MANSVTSRAPSTGGGVSSHGRSRESPPGQFRSDFEHCSQLHGLQTELSNPGRDAGSGSIPFSTFPFCSNELCALTDAAQGTQLSPLLAAPRVGGRVLVGGSWQGLGTEL